MVKEGSTQTYLDFVKEVKDQTVIDPSQPLFHVRPLSPDLHIIIHDYLYPDTSTFSSIQEAHADQDRSLMVDFQFTNEYPPQAFRTVNEQDWDWAVEDIESPKPLETSLQSHDEEVSSDVEYISQKNKERSVMLIPQLTQFYPLKWSFFQSLRTIPSILNYLKHVHRLQSFSAFLEDRTGVYLDRKELVEAFTSKDICTFYNYDILETYGDAFIKYASYRQSTIGSLCKRT